MNIECYLEERQTFAEWRAKQRTLVGVGDFIEDYGDWLVFPEITYCERVASILDESNWQIVSDAVAESEDAVEWSADHWATTYAFYCAKPGSAAATAQKE